MVCLVSVSKINIGVMKFMNVSQKVKPIQPLQIGNEKLKPRFQFWFWLKSFKITINW